MKLKLFNWYHEEDENMISYFTPLRSTPEAVICLYIDITSSGVKVDIQEMFVEQDWDFDGIREVDNEEMEIILSNSRIAIKGIFELWDDLPKM